MIPASIFLLLAALVLVGLYLYAPFLQRARKNRATDSREVSTLQAERDRVINALQELDFDHHLGKIPAEDYPEQRAGLLQKGAEILRRLDELSPADAEARIEKAAAAARADSAADSTSLSDDQIESLVAARRRVSKGKSAGFCPKCGKPVLVSDKFCVSCGKALK
ncbi:MAG: zinc ribbon domain-containing protein [Chloroflexi bacterium]|nr:zinc ribbon domain-containing protein [Chloroflexota bacterium]